MMEQNNEAGRQIANLVWRSLNKDELYEAMNRWYYIHFFYQQVPDKFELTQSQKNEAAQSRRAAFKCYNVFAQLEARQPSRVQNILHLLFPALLLGCA